jgi:hypothetical protein
MAISMRTSSNWNACSNITEANNFESTYGGTNNGNRVAEVDSDGTFKASDDRILCQNIPGFTVGRQYTLRFKASRRTAGSTPSTVSVTVNLDGGAMTQVVSRSNTTFEWTEETLTFTATLTTHRLRITPNFNSSYGFIIDDISLETALPVELSYFQVEALHCEARLDWRVESAVGFSHFELQKSYDGVHFAAIEEIPGENGTHQQDFQYTDEALGLNNYYRLKQVDLDGSYVYSKTIAATGTGCDNNAAKILTYPNPVSQNQTLTIQFPTDA